MLTYFPIEICYTDTGEIEIIYRVDSLHRGRSFIVLKVNVRK